MYANYFITAPPHSPRFASVHEQLAQDLAAGFVIKQIFFYSDAVTIASLESYPPLVADFLEMSEDNHIALNVCSAGFQQRQLTLSPLGQQDFSFKGLGQFIAETQNVQILRHA